MFILIDKTNKKCYPGSDLGIISYQSGKSLNTLRSWVKKSVNKWFENIDFILIQSELLKSRRGGVNEGNKHFFNK
jgi:hypothetical protein